MQILQWLFNTAEAQQPPKLVSKNSTPTKNQCDHCEEDKLKAKKVVTLRSNRSRNGERRHVKRVEKSKLNCDNLLLFRFLQRKDVSRPFFYQTLNLKSLGTFFDRRLRYSGRKTTKTTKRSELETINDGVSPVGGNKILPIADSSRSTSSRSSNSQLSDSDNKDKDGVKKKRKSVSRMKELLKWSATTKVVNSKNEAVIKAAEVYDLVCDESPKISFILGSMEDYDNTTTISKSYSTVKDDDHLHAAIGSWITTDSEFVVLEL